MRHVRCSHDAHRLRCGPEPEERYFRSETLRNKGSGLTEPRAEWQPPVIKPRGARRIFGSRWFAARKPQGSWQLLALQAVDVQSVTRGVRRRVSSPFSPPFSKEGNSRERRVIGGVHERRFDRLVQLRLRPAATYRERFKAGDRQDPSRDRRTRLKAIRQRKRVETWRRLRTGGCSLHLRSRAWSQHPNGTNEQCRSFTHVAC
jgi:hypothetical protein